MGEDPSRCVVCGSDSGLIKKFSIPNIGKGSSLENSNAAPKDVLAMGIFATPSGAVPLEVTRDIRYDQPDGSQIAQIDARIAGTNQPVWIIGKPRTENSSA